MLRNWDQYSPFWEVFAYFNWEGVDIRPQIRPRKFPAYSDNYQLTKGYSRKKCDSGVEHNFFQGYQLEI